MKKLKRTLKKNELFFHMDSSENYLCKYACEPQSVHFGASRKQITLHTGFCTVSACLRHDAAAVLANICPVIEHYQTKHDIDNIDILHFLSDSPSTQYRNKKMFYYIQTYLPILFPNIKQISWNYSEAGHGKGAPDGIGAAVKRCADRLVEFNTDIDTFDKFSQKVTENLPNIYICVIEEQDIQKCKEVLPKNIPCCVGTIKTHQITWNRTNNKIILNSLTC
ncbi:uncharacterized protein [Leptinotarsa decemlineata]|uniref:uncharacterized protein n=1 Tax=Leptinotarsa decemlineata TaxID=7539 RepID=UPI003D30C4BB